MRDKSRRSREWTFFILFTVLCSVYGQCPWSRELVDLHTDCICTYNNVQRLSVQCSPVNFNKLLKALKDSVKGIPIDLLYINNSTIDVLEDDTFKTLDIKSIQLSRSGLKNISTSAFSGLETKLTNLNLHGNLLKEVPTQALRRLRFLREIDLSHNLIQKVSDGAFMGIPITTLKLADNTLNVSNSAFRGLESTLRNLNLKGTGIGTVPVAVRSLHVLSFLDLAQNKISEIADGTFENMHTLTALNLERNRLININGSSFRGVNDSLSSLSLLNNLLLDFPLDVINTLTELRVLDLGFNGIRFIPQTAFSRNSMLTLLALDGNPLPTLPLEAFQHLNSTLRGLSIGGSYLECDCRLKWLSEWIITNNLQVTSRERNPQFCGKPEHLRSYTFSQINPRDLVCDKTVPTTTESTVQSRTTKTPKRLDDFRTVQKLPADEKREEGSVLKVTPGVSPDSTYPTLSRSDSSRTRLEDEEVQVVDVYRSGSRIAVEWESISDNLLGFKVIYRKFGEDEFRAGPALPKTQKRFELENVPSYDCIVVCVVTLEDGVTLTADNVPHRQCRELKREASGKPIEVDKIVIGASAAICSLIIVVVLILVCCCRRKKHHEKSGVPPPAPAIKSDHEWETSSMYSGRSIPRAHMYHLEPTTNGSVNHSFVVDDNRSHLSHYSQMPNGYSKGRPNADGQSHRSYTSNKYNGNHFLGNPELRKSQQSLSQISGHHSFIGSHLSMPHQKKKDRLTSAGSLHSLTEYSSDWNERSNWKDQEVDIYVGQNRAIPTHAKYRKSYGGR
ncbi:uncharacterized protein [Centruroides vittatus]|uniref:uncharacterized protein n=1 Tax=Centruroides vittatus TaxID=120091 RepID=UPI003510A8BA